jgi:hypothetical protein
MVQQNKKENMQQPIYSKTAQSCLWKEIEAQKCNCYNKNKLLEINNVSIQTTEMKNPETVPCG